MFDMNKLFIAKGDVDVFLYPKMANRHGLITGATGTGKTISLKVLAENFSSIGVPVFMADIKGDLASICNPGESNPKVDERIKSLGLNDFQFQGYPTVLWDVFGKLGHPVRTTISEMGPLLLSRLLNLNETQSGVLNIVFKIADDNGMLLLDMKDLRAMLKFVGDNAKDYTLDYGNVSKVTIGAIQRGLLTLEEQGANSFFAEPSLDIRDFIKVDQNGYGQINVLASEQLYLNPALYSTFLLWLLSELFEELPEVGDLDKPKIVFFFDEAHLLFSDAPKVLLDKVEQVVRLIRSKGVGVYFITQNPVDVPDKILGQLGNRVQHALRAFTPRDQAGVKAAADTFRPNPKLDVAQTIMELKVGEALISFLDTDGRPSMVEKGFVLPPTSYIGTITPDNRDQLIRNSPYYMKYLKTIDSESAYELLQGKAEQEQRLAEQEAQQKQMQEQQAEMLKQQQKQMQMQMQQRQYDYGTEKPVKTKKQPASAFDKAMQATLNSAGRQIASSVVRGLLGSMFKK